MRFLKAKKWVGLVATGLLILATLLVLGQARARTTLRWVRGFVPCQQDPRVYYETGAEELASVIARALPAAVEKVEEHQAGPFEKPFRVYVCASHERFARRIGQSVEDPVRGIALLRDIWVSPLAFSFYGKDTHRETLMHELSHLHLGQKLGWYGRAKGLPQWFVEGLADWVADTGTEQVSRPEAVAAIRQGRRIVPNVSGRLSIANRPGGAGLGWPMFHCQSRMFVEYLHQRDVEAFTGLVRTVVDGARFETAFVEHFQSQPADLWSAFLGSLESPPP